MSPSRPEVEAKLKELLDKTKVKKGEAWDAQMKKEIDEIATVTGLSDAGRQSLAAAAKQAIAASLQNWAPDLPDVVRRQLARLPKQAAVAMIVQAQDQLGAVLDWSDVSSQSKAPDQQDVWTKALHQTLTPAQFEAWSQSQAKHKDEIEKQIADVLKNWHRPDARPADQPEHDRVQEHRNDAELAGRSRGPARSLRQDRGQPDRRQGPRPERRKPSSR